MIIDYVFGVEVIIYFNTDKVLTGIINVINISQLTRLVLIWYRN